MATINQADFTPTRGSYIDLSPFRYWCQKVLPLVYDDSLSYYELLNKVVDYLNKTMKDVTTLNGDVTAMYEAYVSLQEYVNTYFDSLDVQEEINNKLDAMALNGSLSHIIDPLIPDKVSDWLKENLGPTAPPVDATLSISGAAADAKAVGDKFTEVDNYIDSFTETPSQLVNLYDFSKVIIGKNWLGEDAPERAIMYITAAPNTTYYYDFRDMGVFVTATAIEKESIDSASYITTHPMERSKGQFTTSATTGAICIQFGKGSFAITPSDFDDYNPYFALEAAYNLCNANNVEYGIDWQGTSNPNRAVIYINAAPNETYYYDFKNKGDFVTISAIEKTTRASATAIVSHALEGLKGSFTTTESTGTICLQFGRGSFPITSENFVGFNGYFGRSDFYISAIDFEARKYSNPWEGKTMVWLGTSIPAAGKYNVKNSKSYPIMVGNILDADVYNEAVGSSALHCKEPSRINANNPYGFIDNFEAVSRCITNSLVEMEWIINHFNDTNVFTVNVPSSLSDSDKNFIRSCSWENKLGKYFNSDMFPDVWVIDHGHNDIPTTASENTYYAKTSITGTQHSGYYSAGSFVSSNSSSYYEYDVTNELFVWISGTFGAWYDAVDLYDANDNLLRYVRYASETTINQLKIDVSKATKLRVSNPNTMLSTINVQKSTYPTYNSLYSYQGGFDFIVNKILTYNPKARIVMIGEYENQKYPSISENQVIASERWELPLFEQWKNTGWSQQPILVNGSYVSVLNANIPDNLHPHSDTTGKALERMAKNIAMWLTTIG